jgi:hypothetical protein
VQLQALQRLKAFIVTTKVNATEIQGLTTMENAIFATVLFIAYFCFGCCLFNNPRRQDRGDTALPETVAPAVKPKQEIIGETEPADAAIASMTSEVEEPLVTQAEQEPIGVAQEETPAYTKTVVSSQKLPQFEEESTATEVMDSESMQALQTIEGIDLNQLSLRACREIAGALTKIDPEHLGISQKVNKKDKPLSQLIAEVKNRLKKDPVRVAPVIAENANAKARTTGKSSSNPAVSHHSSKVKAS